MVAHSLLLIAMTTCFMSNKFAALVAVCGFCLIHTCLLLYQKLILVITRQYYSILWLRSNACLELARIHYSADTRLSACRLESLGTRLAKLEPFLKIVLRSPVILIGLTSVVWGLALLAQGCMQKFCKEGANWGI